MEQTKKRIKIHPRSYAAWQFRWLAVLALSPSFHLAHDYRHGKITEKTFRREVVEADRVLQTYDDFGYVPEMNPFDWMNNKTNQRLFQTSKNTITDVSTLGLISRGDRGNFELLEQKLMRYMFDVRDRMNHPTTLLLAVPMHFSKTKILEMVGRKIDTYKNAHRKIRNPVEVEKPRYQVIKNKLRVAAFKQARSVVMAKIENPNWPLWKVGMELNLNNLAVREIEQFEAEYAASESRRGKIDSRYKPTLAKRLLNTLTSRMINHMYWLAENAARGRFPLAEPILDANGKKIAAKYDFDDLHKRHLATQAELANKSTG